MGVLALLLFHLPAFGHDGPSHDLEAKDVVLGQELLHGLALRLQTFHGLPEADAVAGVDRPGLAQDLGGVEDGDDLTAYVHQQRIDVIDVLDEQAQRVLALFALRFLEHGDQRQDLVLEHAYVGRVAGELGAVQGIHHRFAIGLLIAHAAGQMIRIGRKQEILHGLPRLGGEMMGDIGRNVFREVLDGDLCDLLRGQRADETQKRLDRQRA